jgi:hypothetical protein
LRIDLLKAIRPADVRAVVAAMLAKAKNGDVAAAALVLDRSIGKAVASDVLERLETLERAVNARVANGRH